MREKKANFMIIMSVKRDLFYPLILYLSSYIQLGLSPDILNFSNEFPQRQTFKFSRTAQFRRVPNPLRQFTFKSLQFLI